MKIAVMQPYLFPYIGYFQLINASDKFVFYDDVFFIKQGWINRNRILVNDRDAFFTVPIEDISSYKKINETKISCNKYEKWFKKFMRTIQQNYMGAPFFEPAFNLIKNVFETRPLFINELAAASVVGVVNYLGINTTIVGTSSKYENQHLKGEERIIDICLLEKAEHYINVPGGVDLYNKETFRAKEIEISFIESAPIVYEQFGNKFVSNLSILDVLMFNSVDKINEFINNYVIN